MVIEQYLDLPIVFCVLIKYRNVGSTFSIARCTLKDYTYAFYISNGAMYEYIYHEVQSSSSMFISVRTAATSSEFIATLDRWAFQTMSLALCVPNHSPKLSFLTFSSFCLHLFLLSLATCFWSWMSLFHTPCNCARFRVNSGYWYFWLSFLHIWQHGMIQYG